MLSADMAGIIRFAAKACAKVQRKEKPTDGYPRALVKQNQLETRSNAPFRLAGELARRSC
jgi:hypothetical protein